MNTFLKAQAVATFIFIALNSAQASAVLPSQGSSFFCVEAGQAMTLIIMDDKTINFAGPGVALTATEDANTQSAATRIDFDNFTGNLSTDKNLSDIRVTLSDDRQSVTKVETADSNVIVHTFTNCQAE